MNDPIIEEVRRARERNTLKYQGNVKKISFRRPSARARFGAEESSRLLRARSK